MTSPHRKAKSSPVIRSSKNTPILFVLQALFENPEAMTISELSTALEDKYMPKDRGKRTINIYQTTWRLLKRKLLTTKKVPNPNPLRKDKANAYSLTESGKAALEYLRVSEAKA